MFAYRDGVLDLLPDDAPRTLSQWALDTALTAWAYDRALQQRKAAFARDVLGEDGFARALTRDDLEYLLADA